jgi:hypothetical protein
MPQPNSVVFNRGPHICKSSLDRHELHTISFAVVRINTKIRKQMSDRLVQYHAPASGEVGEPVNVTVIIQFLQATPGTLVSNDPRLLHN